MAINVEPLVIPFLVSMVGVGIALLERGYKRYRDEKATNPDLKFDVAYLFNILLTAGGVGTVMAIITAVIAMLTSGEQSAELTLFAIIGQFGSGYLIAYRVLDALNTRTEKTIAAKEANQ